MKKNMKKKLLTIIMCVLLSVPLIGGIAFAANLVSISNWSMAEVYSVSYGEGKKVKYSLDELIKTYKNSGAEYRKLDLTYQLNDLNSSQLDTQLSSQNEGIYNYTQLINQNEALITTYQNQMTSLEEGSDEWKTLATSMDACYMNLKAYRAYIEEAVAIKADILAQQESYKFIKANAELLSKQEQKKQISVTIERCLSLIVLKEKNNLADSSVEYNNTLLQIQKTNFEKGRATQIDIDYNEAELIYQKNISESISSGYDNLFKYILRTFNISDEQNTEISIDVKGLRPQNKIGYSTVENSFNNNDIKAKQLKTIFQQLIAKLTF